MATIISPPLNSHAEKRAQRKEWKVNVKQKWNEMKNKLKTKANNNYSINQKYTPKEKRANDYAAMYSNVMIAYMYVWTVQIL